MKKLILLCVVVLFAGTSSFADLPEDSINRGPVSVPDIAVIKVDGDLSDWTDSSEVLVFGEWYNGGIPSTTSAQYAFHDANDMLYIGIVTDSAINSDTVVEIGTPTKDGTTTSQFGIATQIQYEGWSGGDCTNTYSYFEGVDGTQAGFKAKYATVGGVTTLEIAMPIWTETGDVTSPLETLDSGDTLWGYACIFGTLGTGVGGDSQIMDGYYTAQYNKVRSDYTTEMIFDPQPFCGDEDHPYPVGDFDQNCSVNFLDFAIIASNWLECTHPDGCL